MALVFHKTDVDSPTAHALLTEYFQGRIDGFDPAAGSYQVTYPDPARFTGDAGVFLRSLAFDPDGAGSVIGHVLASSLRFLGFLFAPRHLLDWRLYVFLYIAFAVGSSVRLSPPDIFAARLGCITFVILLFMFNLVLLPIGVASETTFAWLSPYYTYFYVILMFVMLLNLLAVAMLWLPAAVRGPK